MGNFVKLITALPTPKVDANPPRGLPNELDAADINNLWNALADLRAGLIGPDAIYKLVATGAISRTIFAKLADLISINDFGIGDPTAVIKILENGRVSQLPYIDPFAWFRMDQFTGARDSTSLLGEKQEASTFGRATTGTLTVGGVESTAASGQGRFQDNPQGLLIEWGRTNLISVPDAPVSQAGIVTGAVSYYLRVEGSGSIAVALATGTATGLPGTATAGSPLAFTFSVGGTVNTTVAGTVTFAQLEAGKTPTSRIHTASTRNADVVSFASLLRSGRDWIVAVRAQPFGGRQWGNGEDDHALFTIGEAINTANTAYAYVRGSDGFLTFVLNDAANAVRQINSAFVFLGTAEHDFWFHGTSDGKMEAWIDGQMVNAAVSGAGTGFITTMPANLRLGDMHGSTTFLNGVAKDAKLYYDTVPSRLPQPQWTRSTVATSVVCLGDSMTAGLHVTTPYPVTLQGLLGSPWTVLNAGVSSDATWQTLSRWGAGVRRQTQKYVVMFSGTNDLAVNGGVPAEVSWNNVIRIANQVRSDGKTLVLLTAIPRTPMTTAMNNERVKYNGLIRAYCAAGNATLVDSDPLFDNGDGRTLKAAYDWGDGIHPNDAGAALLASLVAAAIPH